MYRVIRPIVREKNYPILCYYGIRVFSSENDREKLKANKSLGRLLIFLGLSLIIICGVDLSPISNTKTHSEQSIWPSSGRGIWIGLFIISIGIFTLISVKEESIASFYILLPYSIFGIILCLFGLITTINILQRFTKDPKKSQQTYRIKEEGIEFALNGLLIGIFTLTFLFLSCLSCMICWTIPNFCKKQRSYPMSNDNNIIYNPNIPPAISPLISSNQRFYLPTPQMYNYRL